MRVTFVTEHYPPEAGGVATSSKRIAESLVGSGHEVQVLTFDNSRPLRGEDYQETVVEGGVVIHRIGPFFLRHPDLLTVSLSEKHRAIFRRRAFTQMVREARQFQPDAVLAFYLLNAGFLGRFVAGELGVPCIVGVRGNDVGLNVFHVERFAVVRWTLEGAAQIVCVNEHLKRRVVTTFPDLNARTSVILNGVILKDEVDASGRARERLRAATGWEADALIIVFIGTLREKKGIVPLLKAMAHSSEKQRMKLLVVGPDIGTLEQQLCGAEWQSLKDRGAVHCTGQVPREEVASWAGGGDVVVMPSLDDGLANGLLEGMALGLCPVASLIFRDVIAHEENGLLFDAADPGQLVAALLRLDADPGLRVRMGEAAREYVRQHHRPDVEVQQYVVTLGAALRPTGDK